MDYSIFRIYTFYSIYMIHISCSSLSEFHDAIVCITAIFPARTLLLHSVNHTRECHVIWFPDTKVNQFYAWIGLDCCCLGTLYLLEFINLVFLAKYLPAYSLRKQRLNEVFMH